MEISILESDRIAEQLQSQQEFQTGRKEREKFSDFDRREEQGQRQELSPNESKRAGKCTRKTRVKREKVGHSRNQGTKLKGQSSSLTGD